MIGETLGKYRITEHLGTGGMSEVYKAYQPGLDRYVAIKVLHSFLATEEDFLTRFQREAKVAAMLRHPNIVQVYDFDAEGGVYYMVMEFIDGLSLKSRLQEMGVGQTLPLEEAIRIVIAIANGLDYAHRRGAVHRDVKPANIMFTEDGEAILTDFGIAKMVNVAGLTASGAMVGTPSYMSPEQGMGQAGDERADIYSLGVVLYQLATGQLPFDADTAMGIVLKHINDPPVPPTVINTDLPPGIEAVIMRTLAKDPDERYQTAKGLIADLKRVLADQPIEPIPSESTVIVKTSLAETDTPVPEQARQAKQWERATLPSAPAYSPPVDAAHSKRRRITWLTAILVLVLIGGCIGLFATGKADPLLNLVTLLSQMMTPTPTVEGSPTVTQDVVATQVAAALATYVATTGVTPTPSPTPTSTPTATPTPDLTATAVADCVFDLEVVRSYYVWPDVLMPNQRFTKRWNVENTGTCAWPEGVELAFVSGDEMTVVDEPEIEPLARGETTQIKLSLRAPTGYDSYSSVWQLQDSEGNLIGEKLELDCRVGPTPTPRPTATPTATPTPEFTPTPPTPMTNLRIVVTGIALDSFRRFGDDQWEANIYVIAEGGDGNYRFYRDVVSAENEFFALDPEKPWQGIYVGAVGRVCKPFGASWWVTSAGMEAKWAAAIPYPYPEDCD